MSMDCCDSIIPMDFSSDFYDDDQSPFLKPYNSDFLNPQDEYELSGYNYEVISLPDEQKMDSNIIECINNCENINNKKNIKYTNSSEKTDSSTEKNKENLKYTNSSEKTDSSTEKNKEKIFECIKNKEKSFIGKKRKNNCTKKEKKQKINKIRKDHIIKKIKKKLLDLLLDLINNYLKKSKFNYSLYKLNTKFMEDITVNNMNDFLNLRLKDIFSKDICKKGINKLGKDHNKKIIDKISKEYILTPINNILEKTFSDCLDYFLGNQKCCEELNELEGKYEELIDNLRKVEKKSEKYIEEFKNIINNLEEEYLKKKPRDRTKNNKK